MDVGAGAEQSRNWQIVVIRYGTLATTRSQAFLNYSFYGEADGPHRIDYYLWVLRSEAEVIVVDTGYSSPAARRLGRDLLIDPIEALSELGIDPSAGHKVVVTHAHYDHIGNIARFENSLIYLSRAELEFWAGPYASKPLIAHYADTEALRSLSAAADDRRLCGFDEQVSPAAGVSVRVFGGHSPGQAIVEVQTTAGPVILASDVAHFHEEIERDLLFASMVDLPSSYRALEYLRGRDDALIVSGHDAGELARHLPLSGKLAGLAATIGDI